MVYKLVKRVKQETCEKKSQSNASLYIYGKIIHLIYNVAAIYASLYYNFKSTCINISKNKTPIKYSVKRRDSADEVSLEA